MEAILLPMSALISVMAIWKGSLGSSGLCRQSRVPLCKRISCQNHVLLMGELYEIIQVPAGSEILITQALPKSGNTAVAGLF